MPCRVPAVGGAPGQAVDSGEQPGERTKRGKLPSFHECLAKSSFTRAFTIQIKPTFGMLLIKEKVSRENEAARPAFFAELFMEKEEV